MWVPHASPTITLSNIYIFTFSRCIYPRSPKGKFTKGFESLSPQGPTLTLIWRENFKNPINIHPFAFREACVLAAANPFDESPNREIRDVRGEERRQLGACALRQDYGAVEEAELWAEQGALRPGSGRPEGLLWGLQRCHHRPAR